MAGRSGYRRTRRTAAAVGSALLLTFLVTDAGSAAPSQDEGFNKGTGSATALGYKVNPTNGNLSFGITAGESIAGHQNTGATGQSRAINLGVIGITLAGEACDGGDPTLPAEDQPQPVIARSGEDGAEEGKTETEEPGGIEKFARATTAPYAEAITTIAPSGDPEAVFINGGRTITHSGVIDGNQREAVARTELGEVTIGGGAVKLQGLVWEAVHRSGAVEETIGKFEIGTVLINGQATPLPGEGLDQLESLKELLAPLGLDITPPTVRVEQGIVFVDPLTIGVVQSQERDGAVGPLFSAIQPARASLTEALLEMDCGNASYITVADIVLGSVSGAGELTLELGGVQATTAEIDAFQFALLPALPSLPPLGGGAAFGGSSAGLANVPGATAPAAGAADAAASEPVETEPIADVLGERGGLLALVGAGGLLALLASAEADRRKMQHALREIPLEA